MDGGGSALDSGGEKDVAGGDFLLVMAGVCDGGGGFHDGGGFDVFVFVLGAEAEEDVTFGLCFKVTAFMKKDRNV